MATMGNRSRPVHVARLLLCLSPRGFLMHFAPVAHRQKRGSTTQKLQLPIRSPLLDSVARQYNAVRDFSATVDMAALVEAPKRTRWWSIGRPRVSLLSQARDLHLVGLYPVIRTTAFDMCRTAPISSSTCPRTTASPSAERDPDAFR